MYHVYILLCSDNTIYTGFAKNIKKRIEKHNRGEGSKYVRSRVPARLIYSEKLESKSKALKREAMIKSWTRKEKIEKLNLEIGK